MLTKPSATVVTSLAAASLLLAACTTTPESTSTPQPTTTTVAPVTETPTPTPTPTPDELAPIRAALQRYFDVRDKYFQEPAINDPMRIPSVAIDQAARDFAAELSILRTRGYRLTGRMVQRDINLTHPTSKDSLVTSTATYCEDNSPTTVLNSSSRKVDIPPRTFRTTTTLTKMPDDSWVVSHITNKVEPC